MKIISGGQTGADKGGLLGARDLGIETGGYAPLNYMNENGPDISLKRLGLIEMETTSYRNRTRRNAKESHLTLWFGRTGGSGYKCTERACADFDKPFRLVDLNDKIFYVADTLVYLGDYLQENMSIRVKDLIINIAGNRESKSPGIEAAVRKAVRNIFGKLM